MQLFAPFTDIPMSLFVLDKSRVNNQRKKLKQILHASLGIGPWRTHPAVRMLQERDMQFLCEYAHVICNVCDYRGIADYDNTKGWFKEFFKSKGITRRPLVKSDYPWWWGSCLHYSHLTSLVSKDPEYYGYLTQGRMVGAPRYVWPIHDHEWRYGYDDEVIIERCAKTCVYRPRKCDHLVMKDGIHLYVNQTSGTPAIYLLQLQRSMNA